MTTEPAPYYADASVTVFGGDCLAVLPTLPDESVDCVVTDPPYGLEFMGKDWDKFVPENRRLTGWDGRRRDGLGEEWDVKAATRKGKGGAGPTFSNAAHYKPVRQCENCKGWEFGHVEPGKGGMKCVCDSPSFGYRIRHEAPTQALSFQTWCEQWAAECLRILKPGGWLLAFGGTRTSHRLACAIEDAGFEIRDSIAWLYGSGFPKSLDVSKAIDKAAGAERESLGIYAHRPETTRGMWGAADPDSENYDGSTFGTSERHLTAPATAEAEQWQGWGTALKPAHEPIIVARKPLGAGTVAANVLWWGTGALNIDAGRIGTPDRPPRTAVASEVNAFMLGGADSIEHLRALAALGKPTPDGRNMAEAKLAKAEHALQMQGNREAAPAGRWPANVALDESQADALDQMSGELTSGTVQPHTSTTSGRSGGIMGEKVLRERPFSQGDSGGASRFFYTAKAGTDERVTLPKAGAGYGAQNYGGYKTRTCNVCSVRFPATGDPPCGHDDWDWQEQLDRKPDRISHPTVKPLSLMRWLVRLVTPPGGTILEPFGGSGTTVEAALLEGFRCIAIEREADYLPLITQRINRRRDPIAYLTAAGEDLGLFGGVA